MRILPLLLLWLALWPVCSPAQSPTPLRQVIVLNGGAFGSADRLAAVAAYSPVTTVADTFDRIGRTSAQALLLNGNDLFVLAQDSLVRYDLLTRTRQAAAAFPRSSGLSLAYYPAKDQLLVGGWYAFSASAADSQLVVYDARTLAVAYVVAQVGTYVSDIAVVGDTAYLAQNVTRADFSADSAGQLAVVDLAAATLVRRDTLPNDGSNIGRIFVRGDSLLLVGSRALGHYYPARRQYTHLPLAFEVATGNGSVMQRVGDTLFALVEGRVAALHAGSGQAIDLSIIDTAASRFAYDPTGGRFYVTYSNFAAQTHAGYVFGRGGTFLRPLPVGIAPEALGLYYAPLPSVVAAPLPPLRLYPNPATNLLRWDGNARAERLCDAWGRTLPLLQTNPQALDVRTLPAGVYWLVLRHGAVTTRHRLVRR